MSRKGNSNKLERQVYVSYHQDGLLDIMIGIAIMGVGLMMLTDNFIFSFLTWMPFALYIPLKNQVTVPRFGYVTFKPSTTRMPRIVVITSVVLVIILLGAILLLGALNASGRISMPEDGSFDMYFWLGISFLGAIIFLAFLFRIRISRFVLYGVVFLLGVFSGLVFEIVPPLVVIVCGAAIIAYGVWLLVRFLKRYPLEDGEADNNVD